jgi:hypothetical protein
MSDEYSPKDASSGATDNSYVSRPGTKAEPVPVISDTERLGDSVDEKMADTDSQLGGLSNGASTLILEHANSVEAERDDKDAIDQSNILEDRTRGAKPEGGYREPGDEEGLPSEDGTSSADQAR